MKLNRLMELMQLTELETPAELETPKTLNEAGALQAEEKKMYVNARVEELLKYHKDRKLEVNEMFLREILVHAYVYGWHDGVGSTTKKK